MRLLFLITLVGSLVFVAAPAYAQKASSDDELHDKVKERLASDREVKGGGIDVDVKDGVVTLQGKVRDDKAKLKAEKIVRKVPGVKNVVNQLVVEFGSQAKPAS